MISIRAALKTDVPELCRLMRAIVRYEHGHDLDFRLDETQLLRRGFADRPEFGAYVADAGDGSLVGMAVHYEIPFMHTLQPLLMLKWLYVDPELRRKMIGQQLMQRMALHAQATGYDRFFWFVLTDNHGAQAFYRKLGATEDPQWRRWVLPTAQLLLKRSPDTVSVREVAVRSRED
jgi:ribosomal protein S18 acetylase RimI-like enzyme